MLQPTYTNCSAPLFELGLVFICFLFRSFGFAILLVYGFVGLSTFRED